MGSGNYVQSAFLGGEWSKLAQGRVEDPRYRSALARCLNAYPIEEGAWTRRSGFRRGGTTRNGNAAKLLPFEFKEARPLNMELSDGHLRMVAGHHIVTEGSIAVTGITNATPPVVTLQDAVAWVTGDQGVFTLSGNIERAGCHILANRTVAFTMLSTTTLSLYDPITLQSIDGSTIAFNSDMNVFLGRAVDLVTPYDGEDWKTVRTVQSEDQAILLHGSYRPQILTASSRDEDGQTAVMALNPSLFLDGPYLDPFPGSVATPSATSGIITLSLGFTAYDAAKAYKKGDYSSRLGKGYKSLTDANVGNLPAGTGTAFWTQVGFGDPIGPSGFTATDVGRLVRMFSGDTKWTWGRITGLSTTGAIDGNAAGTTKIGDMTDQGGLNALFDGDFVKGNAACAALVTSGAKSKVRGYGGLKINAGSTVLAVTVYPNANKRFGNPGTVVNEDMNAVLYGSNTLPTAYSDGTVLGTQAAPLPNGEFTINSSSGATTYVYMWVVLKWDGPSSTNATVMASQFQFFNNSAAPGGAVTVEVLGAALATTAAMPTWRLGAYGDAVGWPKNGCYEQGRLWLGGAIDNRFDASKSNDPYNFSPTDDTGAVGDGNAISYTVNADDVNPIFWMDPNAQGIIMGTQGGEWLIQASTANNPLTPTTTQAHRVTKYKSANIIPVTIGLSTVFVQKAKRNVLEYISDVYSGKFFAPNLNELSRHITKPGIAELCAQDGLTPILWACRTDGKLIGATYRRVSMHSSEPPKFLGWHRHELGTGYEVVSVCRGPSATDLSDALSIITKDPVTGLHYVEVLGDFFDEDDLITDAAFVDGSLVPATGYTVTVGSTDYVRLYGLTALEGKKVSVFMAGVDCGDFTVESGGYVTVPYSGDFTLAHLKANYSVGGDYGDLTVSIDDGRFSVPAIVGSTFTSQAQMLRPHRMEDTGARQGVAFGKIRRSHYFGALLHNTQGISFGTNWDKLRPAIFRTKGDKAVPKTQLFSDLHVDTLDDEYSYDSQVCWEISRPYPATVAAAGAYLQTQDN